MMVGQQTRNNLALDIACGFTFFYAISGLLKVLMDLALTVASLPRSSEKTLSLIARDQPTMDEREMEPALIYRPQAKKSEEPEPVLEQPPTPEPMPLLPPAPVIEEDDWDPTMLSGYQNPLAQEYGDRSLGESAPSRKKKISKRSIRSSLQADDAEDEVEVAPPAVADEEAEDDPLQLDLAENSDNNDDEDEDL